MSIEFTTYLNSAGLSLDGRNVRAEGSNPNLGIGVRLRYVEDGLDLLPQFVTFVGLQSTISSTHGHNTHQPDNSVPGRYSVGKFTWNALNLDATHHGAGQHNLSNISQHTYGMGDAALMTLGNFYWGGPVAGDEGICFSHVSYLKQGEELQLGTIVERPATGGSITGAGRQSNFHGATAQVIAQSASVQTINVSITSGTPTVDDWIVVDQELPSGFAVLEPVKIAAVGSGTISGVFRNNHANGALIRPATLIKVDNGHHYGQERVLINLSATPYTTGMMESASGGGLDASGTAWSNTMVGGDAAGLNIGAIAIDNDTYTGDPFWFAEAPGQAQGPLRSWHQIVQVTSPTHLSFHTFSCAGDGAYKGRGVFPSSYQIRPAMRILKIADPGTENQGALICEYSTHAWAVNDRVECAICPYPDVTGYLYQLAQYTPNGGSSRGFMMVTNSGARKYDFGFDLRSNMKTGGGADLWAWNIGIKLHGCETGIYFSHSKTAAMRFQSKWGGSAPDDNGTRVDFGDGYIMCNYHNTGDTVIGLLIQGSAGSANGGALSFRQSQLDANNKAIMDFTGAARIHGYIDVEEMAAPTAPAANMARLYTVDNGSGKTRLMAQFASGAAQQISIEP